MSNVNKVNITGASGTSSVGISGNNTASYVNGVSYRESFNFKEIVLEERDNRFVPVEERDNFWTLVNLFLEIIESGVIIKPRNSRDYGSYIVEASYQPPSERHKKHIIYAPLRAVYNELKIQHNLRFEHKLIKQEVYDYVARIIQASSDTDILRLLIVIAHEFGHFISNVRGNHDNELKIGISLLRSGMASKDVTKITWNVFREESSAWSYGKEVLEKYGFNYWQQFDSVKYESLNVYFRQLKLLEADVSTYIKLSMLGDDFKYSSDTVLFK
jgi:hypothetical protein